MWLLCIRQAGPLSAPNCQQHLHYLHYNMARRPKISVCKGYDIWINTSQSFTFPVLHAIVSTRHHGKQFQSHICLVSSSPHQPKTHLDIPRRCCNPWLHTLKVLKVAPAVTGSSRCQYGIWVLLSDPRKMKQDIFDECEELHLTDWVKHSETWTSLVAFLQVDLVGFIHFSTPKLFSSCAFSFSCFSSTWIKLFQSQLDGVVAKWYNRMYLGMFISTFFSTKTTKQT